MTSSSTNTSSPSAKVSQSSAQQTREFRSKEHQKDVSMPKSRDTSASSVSSNRSNSSVNSHLAAVNSNYSNNYPYYEYSNKRIDNRNCDNYKRNSRTHMSVQGRNNYRSHHGGAQSSKVYHNHRRRKSSTGRSGKDYNHNNQTAVSGR